MGMRLDYNKVPHMIILLKKHLGQHLNQQLDLTMSLVQHNYV